MFPGNIRKSFVSFAVTLAVLLLSGGMTAAEAQTITFSNEAAFTTAVSNTTLIGFEDRGTPTGRMTFTGNEYAGLGITFASPNGQPLWIDPPPTSNWTWPSYYLSPGNTPFMCCDSNEDSLTLTFSSPAVKAVGWTFLDMPNPNAVTIRVYDGSNNLIHETSNGTGLIVGAGNSVFWGIVSVTSIARVEITDMAYNGDDVAYDNFRFATTVTTGPTISFSGWVKSSPNWPSTEVLQPVVGAVVTAVGQFTPVNTTVNDQTNGAFTLSGIPSSTTFHLAIQPPPASGYAPVLSKFMNWNENIQAHLPFVLFTQTQYNAFGNATGTGMILGRVAREDSPGTFLAGATVTAQEWIPPVYPATQPTLGAFYPVTYTGGGAFTGTDGIYMVKNVPAGAMVQLTVAATGFTFSFNGSIVPVQAGFISEDSFFGTPLPTISFSGYVMDTASPNNPIGGATIEQAGAIPSKTTTSNADGSYTLTGLPAGTPFHLKFAKDGFTPTYTANMSSMTNIVTTQAQAFNLFPANQLSTWGIDADKGIIRTRVRDQDRNYVGGAVVTAQSQFGQAYQICYNDSCSPTLTSTSPDSGRFIVRNVLPGDLVTVTATKAGWTFNPRIYRTHAGGISQGSITGLSLTAEEQALRDGFAAAVAAINAGNLTGFMTYVSDSYLDDGENKAAFQANVQGLITAGGQLAYALGTISIQGDKATVPVTWTFTIGGQQEVDAETLIFRNENGTWRIYGNQQRHEVRVTSQHWTDGYHAAFNVDDPSLLTTAVTVTGPGITGSLNLTRHEENWDGRPVYSWWDETGGASLGSAIPSTPPTYTITVYEGTQSYSYNRTITGWVEQFATNLSPVGTAGGPVIFTWTGITGAAKYDVELSDVNYGRLWNSYDNDGDHIPPTRSWAVYTGPPLEAGKSYRYWVVARDANENSSFAEGQFTYSGPAGISFTAQVAAAAGGAALPGVSVTIDGNPNPTPSATTNDGGSFTLTGLPAGSYFAVKMAMGGYRPTYTALLKSQNNFTHNSPYSLFRPEDTASWPVNFATKGAIATRVVDAAGNYIAGARVTAQSLLHPSVSYAVTYRDDAGNFGGSSTYANGRFYVLGVDEGDLVTVTAAKNGYTFPTRLYLTHAGGISQGRITGTPLAGTITFSATVNDASGQPVSGAAVQIAGNPAIATLTNAEGGFTLGGIPANTPFTLMFSKTGYMTSYSAVMQSGGNMTSSRPYILLTQANLTAWGIAEGKGAITGRIVDSANPTTGYIAGAKVSATGASKGYAAVYLNDGLTIATEATSTLTNGRYLVPNVDDGDTVSVTASKEFWDFQTRSFRVYANSVSMGSIAGTYSSFRKGDIDGNGLVNLADAVLALQVVAGMQPAGIRNDYATSGADVTGDGKIGLPEVIHIIQVLAGLRVPAVSLQQEAIDGVNASLAFFKDAWNTHGTNYNYLPFFHTNYLNDGLNRFRAVEEDMPPAGYQITSYIVHSVVSFDAAQKIITVEISYAGTNNGVPESGIGTETFIYDSSLGMWLLYGNQRIGEFSVWLGKSRTMPAGGGTTDKLIAHFHLKAAKDMATQVVVNGPGWTQTFANRQAWFDDPNNFDGFYTQQGGMDVEIARTPQAGDVYTFTVYKAAGGTATYTQTIHQVLTEAPTITSPAGHSFTGLAGNRLNIAWTLLPDPGIQVDNIRIESSFMSPAGSVEGVVTSPTGGYIDVPANATLPAHIDVRVHHQDEIFTNCRFEFGP